ncbi:hypothetical protein [Shewanella cyperi]|uniref:hypothetical protein n=1 Tax=Shewanella cyperi TaxID=2814292 RepID=UPI001A942B8F|nr:hypothetical protein [Shewanella cyperi]QSX41873.1 hypothetical protein JYB84_05510 [Shewanella cyperi]
MKIYFLILLLSIPIGANADNKIEAFFGDWCVNKVTKYRGGLTTESEAKSKIGSKLSISPEVYIDSEKKIENPILKFKSEQVVLGEGVVREKDSIFYGVYPDRKSKKVIEVYESLDENYPWSELELINNESFFELYDGYVYVYSKCL